MIPSSPPSSDRAITRVTVIIAVVTFLFLFHKYFIFVVIMHLFDLLYQPSLLLVVANFWHRPKVDMFIHRVDNRTAVKWTMDASS